MSKNFFTTDFAKLSKFKWDFLLNIEDIEKWNLLSENYQKNFQDMHHNNLLKEKIPKNIHQIWIGPKKLPKKYLNWGRTWIHKNPSWKYKLWTEKEIKKLPLKNKNLFESTNNIGFKSDIARYEILYNFGGLYIDTDFECIQEIPDFLRYFDFVSCLGFAYTPVILNGFLMSSYKNKIINEIISELNFPKKNKDPMDIINASGPLMLTNIYFKNHDNNSMVLPSNYCYPYPSFLINSSVIKKDEVSSISFALHHWEMSWMKGNYMSRIINKLIYIFKSIIKKKNY